MKGSQSHLNMTYEEKIINNRVDCVKFEYNMGIVSTKNSTIKDDFAYLYKKNINSEDFKNYHHYQIHSSDNYNLKNKKKLYSSESYFVSNLKIIFKIICEYFD